MDGLTQKLDELNVEANQFPLLKQLEEKTGVKSIYFLIGALFVVLVMIVTDTLAPLLANLTGFVYPVYKSIKAFTTPCHEDDRQWLTYWTVYGLFIIGDDFSSWVTHYIPQYYLFKIIFLIWLFAPTTMGATTLYDKVISGLFQKYSKTIDRYISQVVGEYEKVVVDIKDIATDPDTLKKVIGAGAKVQDSLQTDAPAATEKPKED